LLKGPERRATLGLNLQHFTGNGDFSISEKKKFFGNGVVSISKKKILEQDVQ
jgi:hypothetical protein